MRRIPSREESQGAATLAAANYAVIIRDAAAADLKEACDWYDDKLRRAAMRRFPYGVFYVVNQNQLKLGRHRHGTTPTTTIHLPGH